MMTSSVIPFQAQETHRPVAGSPGCGLIQLSRCARLAVRHPVHELAYLVDRNGKPDSGVVSRRTGDRSGNSNKFSAQVHQRTTGATPVERCIGLDKIVIASRVRRGAVQGTDDSLAYG